jgi:hypothetical protein
LSIVEVCLKDVSPRSLFSPSRSSSRSNTTLALVALLAINALFLLPLWWRNGGFGSAWLVPELLLLPLLMGLMSSRFRSWLLAGVLSFLLLALAGDALIDEVFERRLDLLLDPWLLGAGYHFLSGSLGPWSALAIAGGVAGLTALLVYGMHRLLRLTEGPRSLRIALAGTASLLIGLGLFAGASGPTRPALIDLAHRQVLQIGTTLDERARLKERSASEQLQARPIASLEERDVVIIFIESYGISAWQHSAFRGVVEPRLSELRAELDAAGLEVMSTRLRSPVRGGQSWLAHASLLAGQRIANNRDYRRVLKSEQAFLSDDLAATGHVPLVVAPAIVRPWPESTGLGFEFSYPSASLNYRGPSAGWVGIPDQYTLHHYSRTLRPQHAGPVFALLLLISSHAPWAPGPPMLENWQDLDRARPWPDWVPPPSDRLVYLRDPERLQARYPQSLAYSLEAALRWAVRDLPEGAILLLLGDHQPATLVTGRGTSMDVPVHLISGDALSLARDDSVEFRPGFDPGQTDSAFGIEDLREWLRRRPRTEGPAESPSSSL